MKPTQMEHPRRVRDVPVSPKPATKYPDGLRQLQITDRTKRHILSLVRHTNGQLKDTYPDKSVALLAECMRSAFDSLQQIIADDQVPEERHAAVRDWFENDVLTRNYERLFAPPFSDDAQLDWTIERRIRRLHWMNAQHLDCKIDESNATVRDLVFNAISELVAIDALHAPQAKLDCIARCCQFILTSLEHVSGRPASADDLLPALIFVVLKANPVRVHSNVNFIRNFAHEARLQLGACAYYFTNFNVAISFIDNLTHAELKMARRQFDALMAAEQTICSSWETALLSCDCLHVMQENLQRMKRLSGDTDKTMDGMQELRADMELFGASYAQRVDEALRTLNLVLRPSVCKEALLRPSPLVSPAPRVPATVPGRDLLLDFGAESVAPRPESLMDSLLDDCENDVLQSPLKPSQ